MADINKIKINGTEYNISPEWASTGTNTIAIGTSSTTGVKLGTVASFADSSSTIKSDYIQLKDTGSEYPTLTLGSDTNSVSINGGLIIREGDVTLSGQTITAGYIVSDSATINNGFEVKGDTTISGTLGVTGLTTLGTVTAKGITGSTATIDGLTTINGDLKVTGSSTVSNNITAYSLKLNSNATVNGNISLGSYSENIISSSNKLTLRGSYNGGIEIGGNYGIIKSTDEGIQLGTTSAPGLVLGSKNDVTLGNTSSTTVINGDSITLGDYIKLSSGYINTYNVSLAGSSASFSGAVDISGALTAKGVLNVTSAATFSNTATVSGALKANSTFTSAGAATFNSTITANGAVTANKGLTAKTSFTSPNISDDGTNVNIYGDKVCIGGDSPNIQRITDSNGYYMSMGTVSRYDPTDYNIAMGVYTTSDHTIGTTMMKAGNYRVVCDSNNGVYIGTYNSSKWNNVLSVFGGSLAIGNSSYGSTTVYGPFTVNNGLTASSLSVNGAASLNSTATVSGALKANSTLNVTSAATFSNTATVSGALKANSTLSVTGTSTFTGAVTTNGALTVKSDFNSPNISDVPAIESVFIGGNALSVEKSSQKITIGTSGSTVNINGAVHVNDSMITADRASNTIEVGLDSLSGVYVDQDTTVLKHSVLSNNAITITDSIGLIDIAASKNIYINAPSINVWNTTDGTVDMEGSLNIGSSLTVSSVVHLKSALNAQSSLYVGKEASFNSTATVSGALKANSTFTSTGAATFNSTITANGAVTANKGLTAKTSFTSPKISDNGSTVTISATTIDVNNGVTGTFDIEGCLTIGSKLNVNGVIEYNPGSGYIVIGSGCTGSGSTCPVYIGTTSNKVSIGKGNANITANSSAGTINIGNDTININNGSSVQIKGGDITIGTIYPIVVGDSQILIGTDNGTPTFINLNFTGDGSIKLGTGSNTIGVGRCGNGGEDTLIVKDTVTANGAVTANSTLSVTGASTFTGDVTVSGRINANSGISVTGSISSTSGDISMGSGNLNITKGDVTIGSGCLTVTGSNTSTFNGALVCQGINAGKAFVGDTTTLGTTKCGFLSVTGTTSLVGGLSVSSSTTTLSETTINGKITMGSGTVTVDPSGNVTIGSGSVTIGQSSGINLKCEYGSTKLGYKIGSGTNTSTTIINGNNISIGCEGGGGNIIIGTIDASNYTVIFGTTSICETGGNLTIGTTGYTTSIRGNLNLSSATIDNITLGTTTLGTTTVNKPLTASSTLNVSGVSNLSGIVNAKSTLNVTSAATFNGLTYTKKTLYAQSALSVSGTTTLGGTVTANAAVTANKGLTAKTSFSSPHISDTSTAITINGITITNNLTSNTITLTNANGYSITLPLTKSSTTSSASSTSSGT